MGREVDPAASRAVGRTGKTEGAPGLDGEMDRRPKKGRTDDTARDRPKGRQAAPEDTPTSRGVLRLHTGLRKAESSVLVQSHTGRIGLAKVLYNLRVPEILSAQCRCGAGEETPRHMALYCTEEADRRQRLRTGRRRNYQQLIGTSGGAGKLAEWKIRSGRLGQFSLAKRLLDARR